MKEKSDTTNIKEENFKCVSSTKATSIKVFYQKADDNVNIIAFLNN